MISRTVRTNVDRLVINSGDGGNSAAQLHLPFLPTRLAVESIEVLPTSKVNRSAVNYRVPIVGVIRSAIGSEDPCISTSVGKHGVKLFPPTCVNLITGNGGGRSALIIYSVVPFLCPSSRIYRIQVTLVTEVNGRTLDSRSSD